MQYIASYIFPNAMYCQHFFSTLFLKKMNTNIQVVSVEGPKQDNEHHKENNQALKQDHDC
jgi:hypothetical protein